MVERSADNVTVMGVFLLAGLAVTACGKDGRDRAEPSSRDGSQRRDAGQQAPLPTAPPAVKPPAAALPVPAMGEPRMVAEVLATVSDWAAAQSAGDLERYLAHYDAGRFRGVRRTPGGTEKRLDFAGWRADRAPIVSRKPTVVAAYAQVTTWLSNDAFEPGQVEARFLQRFKIGKYADHGPKVLRFRWHGKAGGWKIVYEDMLSTERGFEGKDEQPEVIELDLTAMSSPLVGTIRIVESAGETAGGEEPAPRILLTFKGAEGSQRTLHLWTDTAGCGVEETPGAHLVAVACFWAGAGLRYEFHRQGDTVIATQVLEDEALAADIRHRYAAIGLPAGARVTFVDEHTSQSR